jgi:hypothetical protein
MNSCCELKTIKKPQKKEVFHHKPLHNHMLREKEKRRESGKEKM